MSSIYLVLGAAGGIGSCLCRKLSAQGDRLALAGRDSDRLRDLARSLDASAHPLDATSCEQVEEAVKSVVMEHGRIDGIVNCVGSILLKPSHRTSSEEWRSVLATNLDSAFSAVKAGTSAMLKTGGSIVLLSSAAARIGLPNHDAIAAAKAGVVGLALSAAASYAARGIRVNVVSPGLVRTPLSEPLTQNPASEKASVAMHALQRLGEPEDVARAIAWFLDPLQSWVTGQVLGVDGGLGSVRSR
ncbi:MAG: NAD(P)-dependent dehydrogenase (short-subunit alcohol dehydrogenase family) [Planctomycetota bacterium]|jgi:NAD(P)-dependent dehydrogenase (short-subunit alcohol dehydrogenase family)